MKVTIGLISIFVYGFGIIEGLYGTGFILQSIGKDIQPKVLNWVFFIYYQLFINLLFYIFTVVFQAVQRYHLPAKAK